VGEENDIPLWEFKLRFKQRNRQRPLVARETARHRSEVVLQRPDKRDDLDPERLTQTDLEQVNANQKFREVAEFLESVRYLHLVPQLLRVHDRSVSRNRDPYGGEFLEQVAGAPEPTRKARRRPSGNFRRINSASGSEQPQPDSGNAIFPVILLPLNLAYGHNPNCVVALYCIEESEREAPDEIATDVLDHQRVGARVFEDARNTPLDLFDERSSEFLPDLAVVGGGAYVLIYCFWSEMVRHLIIAARASLSASGPGTDWTAPALIASRRLFASSM